MSIHSIVAPVIGGFTQSSFGWRFGYILIFVAGLAAIAVVWRLLPETARRTKAVGHPVVALLRSYAVVARSGNFLAHLGIATTSYAGLFAYISGSSFVLQGLYGLSPLAFGLFYGVTSLGFIAGTLTGAKLVSRRGFDRTIGIGSGALAGGGLLLTAAVSLAPSWIVALAAPMMVYLAGLGLVLPLSIAATLQPFPEAPATLLARRQRPADDRSDRRRDRRPRAGGDRLAHDHRHCRRWMSHAVALAGNRQNTNARAVKPRG